MTVDILFEAIGMVRDEYILESMVQESQKGKRFIPRLKKQGKWQSIAVGGFLVLVVALALIAMFSPTAPRNIHYGASDDIYICYEGKYYINNGIPVNELPDDYMLAGTLDKRMTNLESIVGNNYFVNPEDPAILYVYMITGTSIGDDTVDMSRRQWAYQSWYLEGKND